jgi:hypothetical protein
MLKLFHLSLICVLAIFAAPALARPSGNLRIDETATRLSFEAAEPLLSLAVFNESGRDVAANLTISILDPADKLITSGQSKSLLKAGLSRVEMRFPQLKGPGPQTLWYRLSYHISEEKASGPAGSGARDEPAQLSSVTDGIISLSEIAPDLFKIEIHSLPVSWWGLPCHVRVRAVHPVSLQPAPEVTMEGRFTFANGSQAVLSSITDESGYATFDLGVQDATTAGEATLVVTGRRYGLTSTQEADINFIRPQNLLITTDKPLYQPGQELHSRVWISDYYGQARSNAGATLTIADPEQRVVFKADLKTNRFGVASADWRIPADLRLGDYSLRVDLGGDEFGPNSSDQTVQISKYELPAFKVTVKPDRQYYLPGQAASVEVGADYLFGKTLTRGRVRVVRDEERNWNYKEQKWDITEREAFEADSGQDGLFHAHIDLNRDTQDLKEDANLEFMDLGYCAYYTDLSTGRTEQRRFELRLTKHRIHLYAATAGGRRAPAQKVILYLTAQYADGKPARCRIKIGQASSSDDSDDKVAARVLPLASVRTSKYGVAKIEGLKLAKQYSEDSTDDEDSVSLDLSAVDGQGASGHRKFRLNVVRHNFVLLRTDKSIYRPGEPILARILSSERQDSAVVDILQGERLVRSTVVGIHKGSATLVIPYSEQLAGEVTVGVYNSRHEAGEGLVFDSRTVVYPAGSRSELNVDVDTAKASYRPADQVEAKVQLRDSSGIASEGLVGVTVFDQAVEERASTDEEFAPSYRAYEAGWLSFQGHDEAIAGVTRQGLGKLDMSRPIPPDLDLVAELLFRGDGYFAQSIGDRTGQVNCVEAFEALLKTRLRPVESALTRIYLWALAYPTDQRSLVNILSRSGIKFEELRDPWGQPYKARFSIQDDNQVAEIVSAGPDKTLSTSDDMVILKLQWPYFRRTGVVLDKVVKSYHARTGGLIRDRETLRAEIKAAGVDLDKLTDPWGRPYRFAFAVQRSLFAVNVFSGGPSVAAGHHGLNLDQSVRVWTSTVDYFDGERPRISAALIASYRDTKIFPQTDGELEAALARSGIRPDELLDPWGRRYYAVFKNVSMYLDKGRVVDRVVLGGKPQRIVQVVPVTEHTATITLRSAGEDNKPGTKDDFDIATFSQVLAEQESTDPEPVPQKPPIVLTGVAGAIFGIVTDANQAAIAGVRVKATNTATRLSYEAKSDSRGHYTLGDLLPGNYDVVFDATGFVRFVSEGVTVAPLRLTEVNAELGAGSMSETVMISESIEPLDTQSLSVTETAKSGRLGSTARAPMSTPRLRQYFPETLLWQPAIETDSQGRVNLKFKLADSITTWKMRVIGSTIDGRVAGAEKEITAFQPFFIEHDPPPVLAVGDEIKLPVVVRNYSDTFQHADVSMSHQPWFELLGKAAQQVEAPPGQSGSATFDFRAVAATDAGAQTVTATASEAADSVEKHIKVNPDGQEIVYSDGVIVDGQGTLSAEIPAAAIPGSVRAALKIYPNLNSHVMESVEAIMERPYGCAEQSISAAYPSLMVLSYYASRSPQPAIAGRAHQYVEMAYTRLINYQEADGGFSYWGRGGSDAALTAYAIAFLERAKKFVSVDPGVIKRAAKWLAGRQTATGGWFAKSWNSTQATEPDLGLTAYITRIVAETDFAKQAQDGASDALALETSGVVRKGLKYLSGKLDASEDPYYLASFALAAMDGRDSQSASRAVAKLRRQVREEAGRAYWALERNTPFYGWGIAGRVESTALAVRALARAGSQSGPSAAAVPQSSGPENTMAEDDRRLINLGLLFLLHEKDRYGVWSSTQATINVLDALAFLVPDAPEYSTRMGSAEPSGNPGARADVFVNGRLAMSVPAPQESYFANPITVDLSGTVGEGKNDIEIRMARGTQRATAQVVLSYYVPWSNRAGEPAPDSASSVSASTPSSSSLRLSVTYGKTQAKVNDEISCTVRVERVGFSGYGMLVAEIGVPPGAEVDRGSLEHMLEQSEYDISRYEVRPDRVVIYAWPKAGGTTFEFKFRPRYEIDAQTPASKAYDYYNPEATVVLAPYRFTVAK